MGRKMDTDGEDILNDQGPYGALLHIWCLAALGRERDKPSSFRGSRDLLKKSAEESAFQNWVCDNISIMNPGQRGRSGSLMEVYARTP